MRGRRESQGDFVCLIDVEVHPAIGASESTVAVEQRIELRNRGSNPASVGAGKNHTIAPLSKGCGRNGIRSHPALRQDRARMGLTVAWRTRSARKCRKQIEEFLGRTRTTECFRKSRCRGVERRHAQQQYVVAACNLMRMARLMMTAPPATARA
jgi:hypothetical protein